MANIIELRKDMSISVTAAQINALAGLSTTQIGFSDVVAGVAEVSKALVVGATNGLALNRSSGSYGYGINIDGDSALEVAGAAQKSYVVQISGDKSATADVTGDSNDALLKISGNNYSQSDTNFIFRGLNASINNRSGGTLGKIEHSLGTQGKSGGTVGTVLGLSVTAENYGTVSDLFGGIDVLLKNESTVATVEFGIRLRNENNSIAGTVADAILITDTGANTGWDDLIDASGATVNTSILNIAEDGTVAEKDNSQAITNATTAGFLKVIVGGATRYIWLASNAPTA